MLSRGFALVRDGGGHPLRTAAAVQPGMKLDIEFSDGRVGATAQRRQQRAIESARRSPVRGRAQGAAAAAIAGQGSLFG